MKTNVKIEKKVVVDDKENCWWTGKEWIPISAMTVKHLKAAKRYAQIQEAKMFRKLCEFSDKIQKFDEEAEKRGIKLKDCPGKFHKNQRHLREAIKKM
jgi:ribosomal protein S18